jgi:predicted nucleic acid-binding protein
MQSGTRIKVCPDTSYLVAIYDAADFFHARARAIRDALRGHGVHSLYLDCVVNEVLNVLARRAHERGKGVHPEEVLERVIAEIPRGLITWTYPAVPEWYDRCVGLMRESGWALNFHDALIVRAWQEIGFDAIVSFDEDFDLVPGLRRLGSAEDVWGWISMA